MRPGSGKTTTLEGGRSARAAPGGGGGDGDGIVHHAADELFALLHSKAVAVGETAAAHHPVRNYLPLHSAVIASPLCLPMHALSLPPACLPACLPPRWLAAGEAVAKRRRMPAKGFDFFVEASYCEVFNEACHDLLSSGAAASSSLPVRSE